MSNQLGGGGGGSGFGLPHQTGQWGFWSRDTAMQSGPEESGTGERGGALTCVGQSSAGGSAEDATPEVNGDGEAAALEVFQPEERAPAVLVAETLRCQVKITTSRSLHLRIANHTARDVYVRLVGHGAHVAEINTGIPRNALEQSKSRRRETRISRGTTLNVHFNLEPHGCSRNFICMFRLSALLWQLHQEPVGGESVIC